MDLNMLPPMKKQRKSLSDLSWYPILFGNMMGVSNEIRMMLGSSILMYMQLLEIMLGHAYFRTLPNIFEWDPPIYYGYLEAINHFRDITATTHLLPKILGPDIDIHLHKRRTILSYKPLTSFRISQSPIEQQSIQVIKNNLYSLVLHTDRLSPHINVHVNYLGLFEIPYATVSPTQHVARTNTSYIQNYLPNEYPPCIKTRLLFHDHVSCLIRSMLNHTIDLNDRDKSINPEPRIVWSGSIEVEIPHSMPPCAFKYDPLESCSISAATHRLPYDKVQEVLVYLSVFHRARDRNRPCMEVVINFFPFIQSIIRTSLLRNCRINFDRVAPSTPWTLALFYFVNLPVPVVFNPLYSAFYAYHSHESKFSVVHSNFHLDYLIQIIEWWASIIECYDDATEKLETNPLHSQYNVWVFHAVCVSVFNNLLRSLLIGILEPFVSPVHITTRRFKEIRDHNLIFDFDEFNPPMIEEFDDSSAYYIDDLFKTSYTNNALLIMRSRKITDLVFRVAKVFNTLTDNEDETSDMGYPIKFDFEFPHHIDYMDQGTDLSVNVTNTRQHFGYFLRHVFASDLSIGVFPSHSTSTMDLIYTHLEGVQGHGLGDPPSFPTLIDPFEQVHSDENVDPLRVLYDSIMRFLGQTTYMDHPLEPGKNHQERHATTTQTSTA